MKKLFCLILALCLAIPAFVSAESSVGSLYDSAVALAFDTHNVTLGAEATFKYDGEVFKVMHASYQQDGTRSYLSYMLDTPQLDGSVYTGGYTVYGNGKTAYSNDTYWGNYYDTSGIVESNTVLRMNNRTRVMLALGRELAVLAADSIEETAEGARYTFSVGDLPALIDDGIYYLVADYIQDNYYRDVFDLYDYGNTSSVTLYYEDYDALVESRYIALYGAPAPDPDSESDMDPITQARYNVALNAVGQFNDELTQLYSDGVVYVLKDGTAQHYDTMEDYMRAAGLVLIDYWDDTQVMKDYYRTAYGEELSQDTLDILMYTPNPELWNAFMDLEDEVYAYYTTLALEQDPSCVYLQVRADGSLKTSDYLIKGARTLTQQILLDLTYAELKKLTAVVTTDAEGRLSAFEGEVLFDLTDKNGAVRPLEISFSCKAEAYGDTHVPETFVPADYGLVSGEEFRAQREKEADNYDYRDEEAFWHHLVYETPAIIRFMGKDYETMMKQYDDAVG